MLAHSVPPLILPPIQLNASLATVSYLLFFDLPFADPNVPPVPPEHRLDRPLSSVTGTVDGEMLGRCLPRVSQAYFIIQPKSEAVRLL